MLFRSDDQTTFGILPQGYCRGLHGIWISKVLDFIAQQNIEGEGYDIQRKTHLVIDKWKKELTEDEIRLIRKGYQIIPTNCYELF